MSNEDGYHNVIDFDDDQSIDDDDADYHQTVEGDNHETLACKKCGTRFIVGSKGSSELKEMCAKCHKAANSDVIIDIEADGGANEVLQSGQKGGNVDNNVISTDKILYFYTNNFSSTQPTMKKIDTTINCRYLLVVWMTKWISTLWGFSDSFLPMRLL